MRTDQIAIVDVPVIEVALCLHLGLHGLHDFPFAEKLVIDLDTGDLLERLGQSFRFVGVCRYRL